MGKNRWIWLGPLFVIIGAALWGTETYFRVALNAHFDSEVLVFHEHIFCIVFTLPFLFAELPRLGNIPRSAWIYLLLSGSVGSALGTTFFTMALNELNPSVANILLNFQPVVSVVFATVLLNEKLGKGFLFWAAIALLCGLIIVLSDGTPNEFHLQRGVFFIAVTALAWGFSTIAGRGAMLHIPLRTATAGRFIIGAATLFISLVVKGKWTPELLKWHELADWFVIQNYLWLSLLAGVVPLFFYFKGLSKTPGSVAGFCELTQTFSALLLTWGIMKHPLKLSQVCAGIVLLGAVYMINVNFMNANDRERAV